MNNATERNIASESSGSRERDEKTDGATMDAEEEKTGSMNRDPITGMPGSHPLGTAVGTTSGAVAGAFAGAIAGPVGVAVGSVIGAIVGATVGHGSGEELNPTSDQAIGSDADVETKKEDMAS